MNYSSVTRMIVYLLTSHPIRAINQGNKDFLLDDLIEVTERFDSKIAFSDRMSTEILESHPNLKYCYLLKVSEHECKRRSFIC
jgi:hypothetical protein